MLKKEIGEPIMRIENEGRRGERRGPGRRKSVGMQGIERSGRRASRKIEKARKARTGRRRSTGAASSLTPSVFPCLNDKVLQAVDIPLFQILFLSVQYFLCDIAMMPNSLFLSIWINGLNRKGIDFMAVFSQHYPRFIQFQFPPPIRVLIAINISLHV